MRKIAKRWWVGLIVLGFLMIAPMSAAALTNSEVIAILNAAFAIVRSLTQDAWCASGVAAFCP